MQLRYKPSNQIKYGNTVLDLNLSFNRVISLYETLRENDATDDHKAKYGLAMVLHEKHTKFISKLSVNECMRILNAILEMLPKGKGGKKTMDFEKDADMIYAAFMQAYGIDLIDAMDSLQYERFVALLNGLPDNTLFSKVCEIRGRDIPAITKNNYQQIQALIKAKTRWSLDEPNPEGFQGGLNAFAGKLIALAGGKRG